MKKSGLAKFPGTKGLLVLAASTMSAPVAVHAQVLTEFVLDGTNSEILQFSTNFNNLGRPNFNAFFNGGLAFETGPNTFTYATQFFTPSATGTYTFGQTEAPVDTVMIVYRGEFDPSNPSVNFLTYNDDYTSQFDGSTWDGVLPGGITIIGCPTNPARCPVVQADLDAGEEYHVVISTFSPTASLSFPLSFFVFGPGGVFVGGSAAGEFMLARITELANTSAAAMVEQQSAIGSMMQNNVSVTAGQTMMSTQGNVLHTGKNPTTIAGRTTSSAAVSVAHGVTENFTLGATASVNRASLHNDAFDMDTGFGLSVWGQYSEGGEARTGLQVGAALGYMRSRGNISRGVLPSELTRATGKATVETRAFQATLGYGFTGGEWLLTPSLGVAHFETRRSAYTETGSSFSASYDEVKSSRTVVTLDVGGEFAVSDRGRIHLGVGVDHDLKMQHPRLTGTSDVPGLAEFDISSTRAQNRTRAYASLGYTHRFEQGHSISGNIRVGQAVYGTTPSVGLGVTYGMRF